MSGEKVLWTADMIAVLRATSGGRASVDEIAVRLGVPAAAVQNKQGKLGIKRTSRLSAVHRSRIADLASQGWRASRIARQLRLDPAAVEAHMPGVSPATAGAPSSRP